jgi:polyhydroxyalkanoate synthase
MEAALKLLPSAVEKQAQAQYENLLKGIERYQQAYKPRTLADMPTIWQRGSARLLDYGVLLKGTPITTVLLVPSLINRYYILDLSEKQSFARYLATKNIYPIVMDWGVPTEAEYGFDMAAYVQKILLPAIDFCATTSAASLHLAGYCLGGVLTLAATQLTKQPIQSLALLATPWDFEAEDVNIPRMNEPWCSAAKVEILKQPMLSAHALQALFMLRQPFAFEQKFSRFASCDNEREAEEFMQLEQWVNDGVAMTSPAACDCLLNWIQRNHLAKNSWKVSGQIIRPEKIKLPCFVSIPKQDVIVPYGCSSALVQQLSNVTSSSPNAGHVGMIVGSRAKKQMWEPYVDFLVGT